MKQPKPKKDEITFNLSNSLGWILLLLLVIIIIINHIDSWLGVLSFWILIISAGLILNKTINYHDENLSCCNKPVIEWAIEE